MNKELIVRNLNKAMFVVKKYSPEILLGAGIVGTIGGTVMACKATLKYNSVLDEHKQAMDKIHECVEKHSDEYSDEDRRKDTTIVYTQTAINFAKLYAVPAAVVAASIAAIIGSHTILSNRAAAMAAAYSAVSTSFARYRDAVKAQVPVETEEKIFDEATKPESKDERPEPTVYDRFWDCGCSGWEDDPETSLLNLTMKQRYANELLKAKGHLFLNEVYDILGLRRTRAGQAVGWIYDKDKDDLQIDFGIYSGRGAAINFVNGIEQSLLLHFNVQGNILYYINEEDA